MKRQKRRTQALRHDELRRADGATPILFIPSTWKRR